MKEWKKMTVFSNHKFFLDAVKNNPINAVQLLYWTQLNLWQKIHCAMKENFEVVYSSCYLLVQKSVWLSDDGKYYIV
jgi:hypothetical protein